MARDATLAARWLHEPQPISATSQWGWGFHTLQGSIDLGDLIFRPPVAGVVEIERKPDPGMGTYHPWVRRDLDVSPRGNPRRALVP